MASPMNAASSAPMSSLRRSSPSARSKASRAARRSDEIDEIEPGALTSRLMPSGWGMLRPPSRCHKALRQLTTRHDASFVSAPATRALTSAMPSLVDAMRASMAEATSVDEPSAT